MFLYSDNFYLVGCSVNFSFVPDCLAISYESRHIGMHLLIGNPSPHYNCFSRQRQTLSNRPHLLTACGTDAGASAKALP